jgi:hypothetical protein
MEYGSAKERLINNGAFTKAVIKYGTFGALENEKVAIELMELFNMLLLIACGYSNFIKSTRSFL